MITHTITSLISGIFDDDICFSILEIPQGKQDNVSLIDPHLRFHITIGWGQLPRRISTLVHTPFSAFSLEYELTVSRRQNIVLLCVRFLTFWLPGRILDRLHEIQVHACRRHSHSFHVFYFFHPIGQFIIVQYWNWSEIPTFPLFYEVQINFLTLRANKETNLWHFACVGCLFLPLELARKDLYYTTVGRRQLMIVIRVIPFCLLKLGIHDKSYKYSWLAHNAYAMNRP